MIRVRLVSDTGMCLVHLTVTGHAAIEDGGTVSVACAAVSAIVRTAARLIEMRPGVDSDGSAEKAGRLEIAIRGYPPAQREWLRGVSDFLIVGLKDVERDYPEECEVVLTVQEE